MINTIPYTLPVSKFIKTMTALISEYRFNDSLSTNEIINGLVDSCYQGRVDFGKGIINTFKVDVQPVEDLTETSTVLKITKPQIVEEIITIDNYKKIPLSVSEVLTRDAFVGGYLINTFMSYVYDLLGTTKQLYMFDVVNGLYQNWIPTQPSQTITIDLIDTTGMTGSELKSTLEYNSTLIAKQLRLLANNMLIPNNAYTDYATYRNTNDNIDKPVKINIKSRNDLKIVINDKFYTDFLGDAMASLYHAEKVGEMIPGNIVLLPTSSMLNKNKDNVIGWVSSKNKFAYADFYELTLSFNDASTLYQNNFLHFAYGTGIFGYAPGVKIVANYVKPANAVISK